MIMSTAHSSRACVLSSRTDRWTAERRRRNDQGHIACKECERVCFTRAFLGLGEEREKKKEKKEEKGRRIKLYVSCVRLTVWVNADSCYSVRVYCGLSVDQGVRLY